MRVIVRTAISKWGLFGAKFFQCMAFSGEEVGSEQGVPQCLFLSRLRVDLIVHDGESAKVMGRMLVWICECFAKSKCRSLGFAYLMSPKPLRSG
jgi:hypothetical protein